MFNKEDIIGICAIIVIYLLFIIFAVPVFIDKEIARMDAVTEYNCEHYKSCGDFD